MTNCNVCERNSKDGTCSINKYQTISEGEKHSAIQGARIYPDIIISCPYLLE